MDRIPVFFAIDDNYAPCLSCALISAREHASPDKKYLVTVVHKDLREENMEKLSRIASDNFEIRFVEMKRTFETITDDPANRLNCSFFTLTIFFRIFIPEMFKDMDKGLYLDADIMFNRDVSLLWDTDIEGFEYAAARDHYGKYLISPNYINAGVLLFNMAEARRTKLFQKARWWIKHKKLTFADQSALIRSTTKKKMLPQRFNDQKFLHRHTVVRHFSKRLFWLPYPHTDNIKQWHIDKVHSVFGYRQFDDIYEHYLSIIDP